MERLGHFGRRTHDLVTWSRLVTSCKPSCQVRRRGTSEARPSAAHKDRHASRSGAKRRDATLGWDGMYLPCVVQDNFTVRVDEYASRRGAKRRDATC